MKQARLLDKYKLRLKEVDIPSLKDNEVLIKVKMAGICGSDIHSYQGIHPFAYPPIVLGHEFVGEITEIYTNEKYINDKKPDTKNFDSFIFLMPNGPYLKLGEHLAKAYDVGKSYNPKQE